MSWVGKELASKVVTSWLTILTIRVYRFIAAVLSNFAHKIVAKTFRLGTEFCRRIIFTFFRIKIVAELPFTFLVSKLMQSLVFTMIRDS